MRTITTAKGTFEVDFAWAPTFDGGCMIQYADDRRLPEIAADWDMLTTIRFTDGEAMREYDWEGYTKLANVACMQNGKVQINLVKEQPHA